MQLMGQRLVRAKLKIKAAGIGFSIPNAHELPSRLHDVLQAIYAAYGTGWDDLGEPGGHGLSDEALFLGRVLLSLLPEEREAAGLVALMLYCESRRNARRDDAGRFVPLAAQNTQLWIRDDIIEAERLLTLASGARRFGRFQCEAAIQSVHAQRAVTGALNHSALRIERALGLTENGAVRAFLFARLSDMRTLASTAGG